MKIHTLDFVEGAKKAEGITVIIDVFRAFSVACYCYKKGVDKIFPVGSLKDALSFGEDRTDIARIGERGGKKILNFDFGNSPTEILSSDSLNGKVAVQTTHAGTQGLVNARNATEVLTGAFVNAKATANYIKQQNPEVVSLVRMGWEASESTDEDDLCAEYLESLLLGQDFDADGVKRTLRKSPCAKRFLDPAIFWNPLSDFELCTDVDRFDFTLKLNVQETPFLEKISMKV